MSNFERKYDLYSESAKANAYQTFATMRKDDPVFCQRGIDGETMIWFLTRYKDVEAMLRDDKRFVRDEALAIPQVDKYQPSSLQDLLFNTC